MKHHLALLAAGIGLALHAGIPVAWTNSPWMAPRVLPPIPHGSKIEFAVTLSGYTTPPVADGADLRMWFQTNGMGSVWWSAPATLTGDTIRATFGAAEDVGADRVSLFFGAPSNAFAAAVLRLSPAPGFSPNVLEIPRAALDFSTVEYSNAPWLEEETDPTVPAWAKTENPPQTDISGKADKTALASAAQAATNYTDAATAALSASLSSQMSHASQSATNYTDAAMGDFRSFLFDDVGALKLSGPLNSGMKYGIGYISLTTSSAHGMSGGTSYYYFPSEDGTLALSSQLSAASQSATNYTDAATDGLLKANEISSWAKAATKPSYTASEVGATTAEDVYRLIAGTNVVLVVTNYNSSVHAPSMKLQHLDPQSGEYVTYWDETRRHEMTLTNAMDYTDAQMQTRAPKAWSQVTSGLGQEAPSGVTWVSTPETVIAGGYEYEKVITSAGAVWILASNGLTTGATTNSYFRVSATDGTELFSIEKTDSYLIGVNPDGITKSGNTVTIPLNVVAASHPYIRATTNIVNAVWTKEDENGFSCPWASVSWSGTTGAYVATVTCSAPAAFFYFEFLQEGTAKIKQSAKTEFSGGIIFNGTTYMPTVNGNKLEFVAP